MGNTRAVALLNGPLTNRYRADATWPSRKQAHQRAEHQQPEPHPMRGEHDAAAREVRMVAAHSVQGEVLVAIGHGQGQRRRGPPCVPIVFDDDPADASRRQLVAIGARPAATAARRGRARPRRGPCGRRSSGRRSSARRRAPNAGSGSSTGASPAHAKRRMLSTGSTATGRGSALIIAAARRPSGRILHRPTPCRPLPRPDRATSQSTPHSRSARSPRPESGGAA